MFLSNSCTRTQIRPFPTLDKPSLHSSIQPISLGLLRSDLMLETKCENACQVQCSRAKAYCCWKQVEINSIASGFGHLGPASRAIQRFLNGLLLSFFLLLLSIVYTLPFHSNSPFINHHDFSTTCFSFFLIHSFKHSNPSFSIFYCRRKTK